MTSSIYDAELAKNIENTLIFGKRMLGFKKIRKMTVAQIVGDSGISTRIIRNMLDGLRYPQKEEQVALAKAFKISVDRLLGTDLREIINKLDQFVETKSDPDSAQALLNSIYTNTTLVPYEEYDIHYYQCMVYRVKGMIPEQETLLNYSYGLATKELDTNDSKFIRLCNLICQFYYYHDRATDLLEFINSIKPIFSSNIYTQGLILHYQGLAYHILEEKDLTIESFQASIHCYLNCGKYHDAARVEINLAHYFYQDGNYERALEYLQQAIAYQHDEPHIYYKYVALKDYARVLKQVGRYTEALAVAEEIILDFERLNLNYPEVLGKVLLLKSDITNDKDDFRLLEDILDKKELSKELQINMHDILTEHYVDMMDLIKTKFHHRCAIDILKTCKTYNDYMRGAWY